MDLYIINTTYAVAASECAEWKKWVSEELFPNIIRTEALKDPRMFKVMVASEEGNESFCVQYTTDLGGVRIWKKELEATVRRLLAERFGTSIPGFTTILKEM